MAEEIAVVCEVAGEITMVSGLFARFLSLLDCHLWSWVFVRCTFTLAVVEVCHFFVVLVLYLSSDVVECGDGQPSSARKYRIVTGEDCRDVYGRPHIFLMHQSAHAEWHGG